jgi:3-oxoacyl-[acyl-carrier protein] reductase
MKLQNKVAVVTGAGSGIGYAIARAFAAEGATVIVNDCIPGAVVRTVSDIHRDRGMAWGAPGDMSKAGEVDRIFDDVFHREGRVDILVNNAGISGGGLSVLDITEEAWDRMQEINLKGPFLCLKRVIGFMFERRYGKIINIASVAGLGARMRASAHYAAAKGGIIALTRRVAVEAAAHGVNVNAVAPGFVQDTGFTQHFTPEMLEKYVQGIPLGRAATAEEIAWSVVYLASDEAAYFVGKVLVLDGGALT